MQTAATLLAIMPFPDIDPVAIRIGPLAVHWYGLAYVAGILLGWMYARGLVRKVALWRHDTPPLGIVKLDDFLVWAAIGIVVGGRLGYVLFYDLASVLASPVRIFEIWNGGMSFHGGLIGTTLAMIVFARRNGVPIWSMFDIVACAAPIGIFFGRLANFINGELWGRLTDVPWAVVFPNGGPFARHPSQLYEAAMEGLLLFLALFALAYGAGKLKQPGFIAGAFVSLYAIARIVNEFFREPDVQLGYLAGGWLTMGMLLSLPMFALGLWAMMRATRAAVRAVN